MIDRVAIVDENAAPTNNTRSSNAIPTFAEGSYWEELLPQSAPVKKPQMHFKLVYEFDLERGGFTEKMKAKTNSHEKKGHLKWAAFLDM
eukprot:7579741-Ditylum_brightwellii.AAC.1